MTISKIANGLNNTTSCKIFFSVAIFLYIKMCFTKILC